MPITIIDYQTLEYSPMANSIKSPTTGSNIFLYKKESRVSSDGKSKSTNETLTPLDQYIKTVDVFTVRKLLATVQEKIIANEQKADDSKLTRQIFVQDDVTACFVKITRYRQGTIYLLLQISSKNDGAARIVAFTTDTMHSSAICFGTTPNVDHASKKISEYFAKQNIVKDSSSDDTI
jgi:hypothetical protein